MAGLPPDTIHVKRKRGIEDGPVEFLRLERSKRYRSLSGDSAWVYQRKQVDAEPTSDAAQPSVTAIPTIRPTQEGDERRLLKHSKPSEASASSDAAAPASEPPTSAGLSHPTTDRIRRFHLSRSDSPQPAAGVSKKRSAPAVFVERGAKKQRDSLKAVIQAHNVTLMEPTEASEDSQAVKPPSPPAQELPTAAPQQSSLVKYKRPGARARTTKPTESKPTLPPSLRDREGANMDELAMVMDAWTLNEINKNLDKMEEHDTWAKSSPARSRFRPKAPKQRYFERHPESLAERERGKAAQQGTAGAGAAALAVMDVDAGDTTDDDDYVLEMYERVPAERLRDQAVPAHRVGLLVFDTEPDMVEFFYGNESDSEDEFPEDEEDENAENHYTTEYPDEDLEWDDEFDRNAYHYLNQNASDLEEYDERDFVDEIWEKSDEVGGLPG
ncbi:hypothetical protein VTK56DRAFT_5202 [Thermocarpiscus australiensis]